MPQIGWLELLIIVVIAILVIGPSDFPVVLRKLGKWISTFKKYFSDVQSNINEITNFDESIEKKSSTKNKKTENDKKNNSGTFVGHLSELRSRLLKSFFFLIILFVVSYIFSSEIYRFLVQPYADAVLAKNLDRRLIFTALHEAFLTYLKVAFFASFFISSPFFLIQLWKFIAPGLYKNEKQALLPYLVATPILFISGGFIVYYLIMPLAIKFFLGFETIAEPGVIAIQLEAKVNEYLSLIMRLIFAFGISFQLPVILSLLARIGIIDSEYLRQRRKYFVVIIFAMAAILTPPDPITQIGLALPLLLLYELSIITVKFIEKKEDA